MTNMECTTTIVKWNLNIKYWNEAYVITATNIFLLAKGAVKVTGKDADAATREADERNKQAIFKKLCTIH